MDKVLWVIAGMMALIAFVAVEAKEEKIKNLQLEVEQYKFTAQVLQQQCH